MAKLIIKELEAGEQFNPLRLYGDTPFTQAQFYGQWHARLGREVRRFTVLDGPEVVAYWQMLKYPLPAGKFYFYIPYGPVVKTHSELVLSAIGAKLYELLKEAGGVFARADFSPSVEPRLLSPKFFHPAPLYTYDASFTQPRTEWVLTIDKPPERLLAEMVKDARYSIRLATRKGVKIKTISANFDEYFDSFYDLMRVTSKRNQFGLHEREYYQSIFASTVKTPSIYLVVAEFEGEVLVIDVVVVYGSIANYIYSGSSNANRKLMPTYGAIWQAILEAQKRGVRTFNFGGYALGKTRRRDSDSLDLFKRKFGGHAISHSPFYDVVAEPLWYHLYGLRRLLKSHF